MNNSFEKLLHFLTKLEQSKIAYSLAHHREETVMVMATIPGERWEIEFFADGSVEIERFGSKGELGDESLFAELFATNDEQILVTSH